jgi:hypothetical protein
MLGGFRPFAAPRLILVPQAVQGKRLHLDLIACGQAKPVRNGLKVHVLHNDRNIIASPGTGHSKTARFKTNNLDFDLSVRRSQEKIVAHADFATVNFASENNRSSCNLDGIDHSKFEGHID